MLKEIENRFVKHYENPYGFILVKEVQDSDGNLRLSINDIWRCLYIAGIIPPGFCQQTSNLYRNWRWPNYIPQEVYDREVYDWYGLLTCIYALKIFNEKIAFCLAYVCDYGRLDNAVFIRLKSYADGIKKNQITDENRLRKASRLLFDLANRTYSDLVTVPQEMRKEYLQLCKEAKDAQMPQLIEQHFNLQEVRIIFDCRDKGGHPRIPPYELIDLFKRKVTPSRFIDNPFPELKGIKLLEQIPHYAITEAYNLVDMVGRITQLMPELTELQLFNLIYISDYGAAADNPMFDALSRYEAFSKRNKKHQEDPYGYVLNDLKSKPEPLRILAAYEDQ